VNLAAESQQSELLVEENEKRLAVLRSKRGISRYDIGIAL